MITRRLLRPASAFASSGWTCTACARASIISQTRIPQQQKRAHHVPPLTYDETFTRAGIPGLLSPHGYLIAWSDYQESLVNKLNELTAGEPIEHAQTKDLAIQFARDPMSASLFNHASMAHNNHFFFSTLAPVPLSLEKVPSLKQSLCNTFGTIDTLKATMLDTAATMFGPGYVWLVWARNLDNAPVGGSSKSRGSWRILTTYLAGTPYPEAGYRQQGIDANNQNAHSYNDYMKATPPVGMFGAHSKSGQEQAKMPPGGTQVLPVLCVNTWEHVWLRDYGINGKRKYLADWWGVIDWGLVEQKTPTEASHPVEFIRS
ncbi:hypothetical protein LTR62_005512 [Meristemomyces frigidus]|uniref:Manganese/iron superoxide dismutase C-terminal domain-containing protein n=1 Tax=Meristemomyces frigidus TaxID=1508187 RepID=A0AAN7TDN0_9PEZI|nr:hypothetical protein LTR62_005512 [Meristemomyces frigidus]